MDAWSIAVIAIAAVGALLILVFCLSSEQKRTYCVHKCQGERNYAACTQSCYKKMGLGNEYAQKQHQAKQSQLEQEQLLAQWRNNKINK